MMKKQGALFLLLTAVSVIQAEPIKNASCRCEANSKTYFKGIPTFSAAQPTYISSWRHDRLHAREDGRPVTAQVAVYGGKSQNSTDLARFFLPICGDCVTVREEVDTTPIPQGNLLARNFNIFTLEGDFESRVTFAPKQSIIGAGFSVMWGFAQKEDEDRGFWFEFSFPVERIRNNMNLCEKVLDAGGGVDAAADADAVANMKEAFRQKAWKYGKIGCKGSSKQALSKTGVADIELRLGHESVRTEICHLESYIGFIAPTGNKPKAEFVFEPVVGNGHHWGVMIGSSGGYRIWANEEENKEVRIEFESNARFLFSSTEKRSFDLVGKPWSRYIEMYEDVAQATAAAVHPFPGPGLDTNFATPGINILTRDVKVDPNSAYTCATAITFTKDKFLGEFGVNLYARETECICLKKAWKLAPAIKAVQGNGLTNPDRDITPSEGLNSSDLNETLANYDDSRIREEQLDLKSAANQCIIAHTVYGSLGARWDEKEYPFFINAGGSYQFSRKNNGVMDRWVVWGKFGVSY